MAILFIWFTNPNMYFGRCSLSTACVPTCILGDALCLSGARVPTCVLVDALCLSSARVPTCVLVDAVLFARQAVN